MLKKQQSTNLDLQFVQDNVDAALSPLQAVPMVGGRILLGIAIGTSQTAIPHGLGRLLNYWILVDQTSNAVVWRSAASDSRFVYLTASAACTATLWVN